MPPLQVLAPDKAKAGSIVVYMTEGVNPRTFDPAVKFLPKTSKGDPVIIVIPYGMAHKPVTYMDAVLTTQGRFKSTRPRGEGDVTGLRTGEAGSQYSKADLDQLWAKWIKAHPEHPRAHGLKVSK